MSTTQTIIKKWNQLQPFEWVLGGVTLGKRGIDRYSRCLHHDTKLRSMGYTGHNKPIVAQEDCKYCIIENDIIARGQLDPAQLYDDGKTIGGPSGNHRSFIIGIMLNQDIKCIVTDRTVPTTLKDWLVHVALDEMVARMDMDSIIGWIEAVYDPLDPDVTAKIVADNAFQYKNGAMKGKIREVHYIYDKVIPFLKKHPEFRGRIMKPGVGHCASWDDMDQFGEIISFNALTNMIYGDGKKGILGHNAIKQIKETSVVLGDTSIGTRQQYEKIRVISKYWGNGKVKKRDPLKIKKLAELLEKHSTNKGKAIDLFAQMLYHPDTGESFSTTSKLIDFGYDVTAVGNEVNKYMTETDNLHPKEIDVYKWIEKNLGYGSNSYRWINIDPLAHLHTQLIVDLAGICDNLTYVMVNWRNWSYKDGAAMDRSRFGFDNPKPYSLYVEVMRMEIEEHLDDNKPSTVNIYPIGKGNYMIHISRDPIDVYSLIPFRGGRKSKIMLSPHRYDYIKMYRKDMKWSTMEQRARSFGESISHSAFERFFEGYPDSKGNWFEAIYDQWFAAKSLARN